MRNLFFAAIAALMAPAAHAQVMNNVNLPGADIANFWSMDANHCRASCNRDGRCVAWTWVRPGIQGPSGRCWLKGSVPPQQANNCCISGIERTGRPPVGPGMMGNVNLPGGDYANYWSNDPNQCRASCQRDGRCVAWTWVRQGVQGASGRCWLKNSVPRQQANNCCV